MKNRFVLSVLCLVVFISSSIKVSANTITTENVESNSSVVNEWHLDMKK